LCPSHSEVADLDISAQIYWSYWDALIIKDGVLYKKWVAPNLKTNVLQLVVLCHRVKEILEKVHDSLIGEHLGVNKTLEKIWKRFYWATCKQDIENWCKSCKRVQMNVLGLLPKTHSGNRFVLVIVDCGFTKWVEAFLIKNIRAKTIAEVFVREIISRHRVPSEIHIDQGQF